MTDLNLKGQPYNSEYGDDRLCICGHDYYRHFDTHEGMYPLGCKYCSFSSEKSRDQLAAEPGKEIFADATWCPGFTPADGVHTPNVAYNTMQELLSALADRAKMFIDDKDAFVEEIQTWPRSIVENMVMEMFDGIDLIKSVEDDDSMW